MDQHASKYARRKRSEKHGGSLRRLNLDLVDALPGAAPDDLQALDEALEHLTRQDPKAAQLVKLHCSPGLTVDQAAGALELSRTNAYRLWTFARAWLYSQLRRKAGVTGKPVSDHLFPPKSRKAGVRSSFSPEIMI
jgi:hypothetical protein